MFRGVLTWLSGNLQCAVWDVIDAVTVFGYSPHVFAKFAKLLSYVFSISSGKQHAGSCFIDRW